MGRKTRRQSTEPPATPASVERTKKKVSGKSERTFPEANSNASSSKAKTSSKAPISKSGKKAPKKLVVKHSKSAVASDAQTKGWPEGLIARYLSQYERVESVREGSIPKSYCWKHTLDGVNEQQEYCFSLERIPEEIKEKVKSIRVLANMKFVNVDEEVSNAAFNKQLKHRNGIAIQGLLINPNAVLNAVNGSAVEKKSGFVSDEQLKAACLEALDELIEEPISESFREPVDWEELGLDDYPVLVPKPMDLGTVHSKLIDGEYDNEKGFAKQEFEADVRLVFHNCHRYNKSGSEIYVAATELLALFQEYLRNALSNVNKSTKPLHRRINGVEGMYWESQPEANQARLWMWTSKGDFFLVWSPKGYVRHPFLANKLLNSTRMPIHCTPDLSTFDVQRVQDTCTVGLVSLHINYLLQCQMLERDLGKVLTLSTILASARSSVPLRLAPKLDVQGLEQYYSKHAPLVLKPVLDYFDPECCLATGVSALIAKMVKSKSEVRQFFKKLEDGPESLSLQKDLDQGGKYAKIVPTVIPDKEPTPQEPSKLKETLKPRGRRGRSRIVGPDHPVYQTARSNFESSLGEDEDEVELDRIALVDEMKFEASLDDYKVVPMPRPMPGKFSTRISLPKHLLGPGQRIMEAKSVGAGITFNGSEWVELNLHLPPDLLSRVISVHSLLHHFWFLWGERFPTFKLEELVAALCSKPGGGKAVGHDVAGEGSTLLMEQLHIKLLGFLAMNDPTFALPAQTVTDEEQDVEKPAENDTSRFTRWLLERAIHCTGQSSTGSNIQASVSTFGLLDDNRAYTWQWKDKLAIGKETFQEMGYHELKKPVRDYCSFMEHHHEAREAHFLHSSSPPINSLSWTEYLCEYMSQKLGIERKAVPTGSSKELENYNLTTEERNNEFLSVIPSNVGGQVLESARKLESNQVEQIGIVAKACKNLVEVLFAHPLAGPFLAPVDSTAAGLKSYPQIVKHPMDLGTVLERLNVNYYETAPGHFALNCFVRDMRLIWENCLLFHKKTSAIVEDALHLSAVFEERLHEIIQMDVREENLRSNILQESLTKSSVASQEEVNRMWLDPSREAVKLDLSGVPKSHRRRSSGGYLDSGLGEMHSKPQKQDYTSSLVMKEEGEAELLAVLGPNSKYGKSLRPIPLVRMNVADQRELVREWRIFSRKGSFLPKISVGAGRKHYVFLHPDGTRFTQRLRAMEYGEKTGIELEIDSDGEYRTTITQEGTAYIEKFRTRMLDYQGLDSIKYKMELMLNTVVEALEAEDVAEVPIAPDSPFLLPVTVIPTRANDVAGIRHLAEDEYFQHFGEAASTAVQRIKQAHRLNASLRAKALTEMDPRDLKPRGRGRPRKHARQPATPAKETEARPRKQLRQEPALPKPVVKRGRGRPRKHPVKTPTGKPGRGRPRKEYKEVGWGTEGSADLFADGVPKGVVVNTQASEAAVEEPAGGGVGRGAQPASDGASIAIEPESKADCEGGASGGEVRAGVLNNRENDMEIEEEISKANGSSEVEVAESKTGLSGEEGMQVEEANKEVGEENGDIDSVTETPRRRSSRRSSVANQEASRSSSRRSRRVSDIKAAVPTVETTTVSGVSETSAKEGTYKLNSGGAPLANNPYVEALCLLEELMTHPFAPPFNFPVDTSLPELEGYLELVPFPMDFGTIQTQLFEGVYGDEMEFDIDGFKSDVIQVFHNCYSANELGSPLTVWAMGLHMYFDELLENLRNSESSDKEIPEKYNKDSITSIFQYAGALSRECKSLVEELMNFPAFKEMSSKEFSLTPVLEALDRGDYNMGVEAAQIEIGFQFAQDVRDTFSRMKEACKPETLASVTDAETHFNTAYHSKLAQVSQSKWPWVGEKILWYDNRAGKEGIKTGVVKDVLAQPRYKLSQMKKKRTDFGRLRVQVEGERGILPLNLWTPATADTVKELMSYPNLYLAQWAFVHDPARVDFATTDSAQAVEAPLPPKNAVVSLSKEQKKAKESVQAPLEPTPPASTKQPAPAVPKVKSQGVRNKYHTVALRSSRFNQSKSEVESKAVKVRRILKNRERYNKRRDAVFGVESSEILLEHPSSSENTAVYPVPEDQLGSSKKMFPCHWEMPPVDQYYDDGELNGLADGLSAATPYSSVARILELLQERSYNSLDPCDRLSLLELLCEQVLQVNAVRDSLMTEREIEAAEWERNDADARFKFLKMAGKKADEAKQLRESLNRQAQDLEPVEATAQSGVKRPRGRPPKSKGTVKKRRSSAKNASALISRIAGNMSDDDDYELSSDSSSVSENSDPGFSQSTNKRRKSLTNQSTLDSQGDEEDLKLEQTFQAIFDDYIDSVVHNVDAPEVLDTFEPESQDLLETLPLSESCKQEVPRTGAKPGFLRVQAPPKPTEGGGEKDPNTASSSKDDVEKKSISTGNDKGKKGRNAGNTVLKRILGTEPGEHASKPQGSEDQDRRSTRRRSRSSVSVTPAEESKTEESSSVAAKTAAQRNLAAIIADRRRKAYRRRSEIVNRLDLQEMFTLPHRVAKQYLAQIFADKNSFPFQEPVDAEAMNLANYNKIIYYPMDLSTVKKKMQLGAYNVTSAGQKPKPTTEIGQRFLNDLELIVLNCCTYNQEDSPVFECAVALEAKINKMLGVTGSRFELQGSYIAREMVSFLTGCFTLVEKLLEHSDVKDLENQLPDSDASLAKQLEDVLEKLTAGYYYEHSLPGESYPSPRFARDMRRLMTQWYSRATDSGNSALVIQSIKVRDIFEKEYVGILKGSKIDARILIGELVAWNQDAITTQTAAIKGEKARLETILKTSGSKANETELGKQLFTTRDHNSVRPLKRGRLKSTRQLRVKQGERKKWTFFLDDGVSSKSAQSRLTFATDPIEVDIGVLVYGLDWCLYYDSSSVEGLTHRFGDFVPVQHLTAVSHDPPEVPSSGKTAVAVKRGRPTVDKELEMATASEGDSRILFKLQLVEELLVVGHLQREYQQRPYGPHQSVPPRVPCLGSDRYSNRYWYFGAPALEHTHRSRFVFVELSPLGRDYLKAQMELASSLVCHCGASRPEIGENRFERTRTDLVADALGTLPASGPEPPAAVQTTRDLLGHKESRLQFEPVEEGTQEEALVGAAVRKFFVGSGWFRAVVCSYDREVDWYRVEYVDGGVEDLTLEEVLACEPSWVTLQTKTARATPSSSRKSKKSPARAVKRAEASPVPKRGSRRRSARQESKVDDGSDENGGSDPNTVSNEPKGLPETPRSKRKRVYVPTARSPAPTPMEARADGPIGSQEGVRKCTCTQSTMDDRDVQPGNLLVYTGRAQIEELIMSLNEFGEKESHLRQRLIQIYPHVVLAMKSLNAEMATCQVPRLAIHGERWFDLSFPSGTTLGRVDLECSSDVMGGCPVVSKCRISAAFQNVARLDSKGLAKAEDLIAAGDVIVAVNNFPLTGVSKAQQASLLSKLLGSRGQRSRIKFTVCRPGFHTRDTTLAKHVPGFDETLRASSSAVIGTLRRSTPPAHSALSLLLSLENQLWALLHVDRRVTESLLDWRWLHNWGPWHWPLQRERWIAHVTGLIQKIEEDERLMCSGHKSNAPLTREEVSLEEVCKLLGTLERAYVSTTPNVHPYNNLTELSATLVELLENVSNKHLFLPNVDQYKLEYERLLPEMPTEGAWLGALMNCHNMAQIHQLAFWLYVESTARFSSTLLTAKHVGIRMAAIEANKSTLAESCCQERDDDSLLWRLARERHLQALKAKEVPYEPLDVSTLPTGKSPVIKTAKGRVVGILSRIGIGIGDSDEESHNSLDSMEEESTNSLSHLPHTKLGTYHGVLEVRGHFRAELRTKDDVVRSVGRYDTELEAAIAHDVALRQHYGSKGTENLCNFGSETIELLRGGRLPHVAEIFSVPTETR